jgi:hypothetical protein
MLEDNLKTAHRMWTDTGLGTDFTILKVSDADCAADRENVLVIKYTATG